MKDLIDLGNLVFTQLVKEHGEIEESRLLFLYNLTQKLQWSVLSSNKWILIEAGGVTKNFFDPVIERLSAEWLELKQRVDYERLERILKAMRAEYDRPAPKDGDVWEFGNSGGSPFRSISI